MSKKAQAGRNCRAYLLTLGTEVTDTGVAGSWYFVKAKATSGSAIPSDIPVNKPFRVGTALTLVEGDILVPISKTLLGFAKDKSVSGSKGTLDVTCDEDNVKDVISDKLASKSVDISGNNFGLASDPVKTLENHFGDIITDDGSDTYELTEVVHSKIWLMIAFMDRDLESGGSYKTVIIPVVPTSIKLGGAMSSVQDFSIQGEGAASDENGYEGVTYYGVEAE